MLIVLSLCIGGLALLYTLFAYVRRHRRVSGGFVLAAAMLTLQAIFHPPNEQLIAQQMDEEDDQDSAQSELLSLRDQIHRQAKRIRSGRQVTSLTLRLPALGTVATPSTEDRKT